MPDNKHAVGMFWGQSLVRDDCVVHFDRGRNSGCTLLCAEAVESVRVKLACCVRAGERKN